MSISIKILFVAGLFSCVCLAACRLAPTYDGSQSSHFDGTRFTYSQDWEDKSLSDLWRWVRTRDPVDWGQAPPLEQRQPVQRIDDGELQITIITHATALIQADRLNVLTDPIWSDRTAPVQWLGPKRKQIPGVAFDELPPIDVVLISHNHYDHLDSGTIKQLEQVHAPLFIVPLNNRYLLERFGVNPQRIVELDWWEGHAYQGVTFDAVPAQHWSRRGLFDTRKSLWAGFVLKTRAGPVYFAGDTGYPARFKEIRERYGRLAAAVLPIGAYEPRWFMRAQHMNPQDAVLAWDDLGRPPALGMHFGTFQLTDEGRDTPVIALQQALASGHASDSPPQFIAPTFGQSYRVRQATLEPIAPSR